MESPETVDLKSKNGKSRNRPRKGKMESQLGFTLLFSPHQFAPLIVTNWSQELLPPSTCSLGKTKSFNKSIQGQISALVNAFGGFGVEIRFLIDKYSRIIKKGAEPQSGTTSCLKRHDALQASIRKCLLFSTRSSAPALSLTKENY